MVVCSVMTDYVINPDPLENIQLDTPFSPMKRSMLRMYGYRRPKALQFTK